MSAPRLTVTVRSQTHDGDVADVPVVLRNRLEDETGRTATSSSVDVLDDLFDPSSPTISDWREHFVDRLRVASSNQHVCYVTLTAPVESDLTIQHLLQLQHAGEIELKLTGNPLPATLQPFLANDAPVTWIDGLSIFEAAQMAPLAGGKVPTHFAQTTVISNVRGEAGVAAVVTALGRRIPQDVEILALPMAGESPVQQFTLANLRSLSNRVDWYLVVPPAGTDQYYRTPDDLQRLVARLRAPDGCPWDREQTHQSLMRNMIEETYELIEAIHINDSRKICEELGDFLLQAVLHAQIAEDQGTFTLEDVTEDLIEKLIRRHPHVFASVDAEDSETVVRNWETIKQDERSASGASGRNTPLGDIPLSIPAIMRAQMLIRRAFRQGQTPETAAFHRDRALERTGTSDFERDTLAHVLGYVAAATAKNVDLEALLRNWSRQFEQSFAEDRPANNPN